MSGNFLGNDNFQKVNSLKKNLPEVQNDNIRTNIIYFTTKCNLNCTYCFQALDEVMGVDTPWEDLKKIVDETIQREGQDYQTFFGIFGGEPTLCWHNVEKFMDYAYSKKKNIHFEMISNGIKFCDEDFLFQVAENEHVKNGRLSISISFDGWEGNKDRVFRDGRQSREKVIQALSNLKTVGIPFRVRFTIHRHNIDTFVDDILKIMEYFEPKRVITSETNSLFNDEDFKKVYEGYTKLRTLWNERKIQIPVCEVFCDSCDGCSMKRPKLTHYIGDKEFVKDDGAAESFKHFDHLRNTKKSKKSKKQKEG